MKSEHKITATLTLYSSSPRDSEEITKLVRDYLTNELTGVYLLTEDEVDEVSFEAVEC